MFRRRSNRQRIKGPSDRRWYRTGCFATLIIAAFAFTFSYLVTGRYQPSIPPPVPLPNPNGFQDYVAAANLFQANGGEKMLLPPKGVPDLTQKARVVQANAAVLARMRAGM